MRCPYCGQDIHYPSIGSTWLSKADNTDGVKVCGLNLNTGEVFFNPFKISKTGISYLYYYENGMLIEKSMEREAFKNKYKKEHD